MLLFNPISLCNLGIFTASRMRFTWKRILPLIFSSHRGRPTVVYFCSDDKVAHRVGKYAFLKVRLTCPTPMPKWISFITWARNTLQALNIPESFHCSTIAWARVLKAGSLVLYPQPLQQADRRRTLPGQLLHLRMGGVFVLGVDVFVYRQHCKSKLWLTSPNKMQARQRMDECWITSSYIRQCRCRRLRCTASILNN